jgi:hypothetical protein
MMLHALVGPTLSLVISSVAMAVPSPSTSTVPECVFACPAGDRTAVVTVRDIIGNPIAGSTVQLDMSQCGGFPLCPECLDLYLVDGVNHTVLKSTDATGVASFSLCGGPACGAGLVRIFADGVWLGTSLLAPADLDGDLHVTDGDRNLVLMAIGGTDRSRDLNCDGAIGAGDVAVIDGHLGHHCPGSTPTRAWSWTRTKLLYR